MFVLETNDKLRFYPISVLSKADIASVINTVRKRVLNYFVRRNFLEKYDVIEMLDWKHNGGFSVDASVLITDSDRKGLEI